MFESYLHCPLKCFQYRDGSVDKVPEYSEWQRQIRHEYEQSAWKRLCASFPPSNTFWGNPAPADLQSHRYKLIGEYQISTADFEARLNAIQLADLNILGYRCETYTPLRFVLREKLCNADRLCLAFDALALSSACGHLPHLGKLIHGQRQQVITVRLDKLITKVRHMISRIRQHDARNSPPLLILNRHCHECDFQLRCRAIATEQDDLSLLGNFREKEWKRQHEKGIFTVTQLSYTFRPRKRLTTLSLQHHHALKALAIRTNKIHVFASVLPDDIPGVPVFVDVEGDSDRGFYYLIGLQVCRDGSNVQYSFWADKPSDEETIWSDFLRVLASIDGARIVHYGSYETAFFKRMRERYGEHVTPAIEGYIAKALNILSVIHDHVFFPTYSNSLKDIAQYFGFRWSESSASGLSAIMWRSQFESAGDPAFKAKLLKYNAEDCEALRVVTEKVWALTSKAGVQEVDVVDASIIKREYPQRFGEIEFVLPQFKAINEAAYWDYQRSRIYVRTLRKPHKNHKCKAVSRARVRLNKVVSVHEHRPKRCPQCGWTIIYKWGTLSQTVYDLRLTKAGVKRWVVRFVFHRFICWNCKKPFQLYDRKPKYGIALVAYVLYQLFEMHVTQNVIGQGLARLFGLPFSRGGVNHLKAAAAERYRPTYDNIVRRLVGGKLIQADETKVRIDGYEAYVWVFTSLQDVAFVYRPTREADFLHKFLRGFSGVLVSDFYSGYDSIQCAQQKCLIHLMRDMNDDLRKQPFNGEMRMMAEAFAELLRTIVATVDRFGLKRRYLRKHKAAAEGFLDMLRKSYLQTEAAAAYKTRFEKNSDTLFTFLDYDGVPWNNNNAEHAIKAFARLRRSIGGTSTAKGIEEYLILLSISETCKAKGIDVLQFFLSDTQEPPN
ncbi:MAG TPA: IS66 family transposase [Terriglobales bacterium]|nr:IS66 family transposase [Terriglobales bacterium]